MSTTTNSLSTPPSCHQGRSFQRQCCAESVFFSQGAASLVVRVPSLANNTLLGRGYSFGTAFMRRFIRTRFFVTPTQPTIQPPNVK